MLSRSWFLEEEWPQLQDMPEERLRSLIAQQRHRRDRALQEAAALEKEVLRLESCAEKGLVESFEQLDPSTVEAGASVCLSPDGGKTQLMVQVVAIDLIARKCQIRLADGGTRNLEWGQKSRRQQLISTHGRYLSAFLAQPYHWTVRSCLQAETGSLPCELVPLIDGFLLRTELSSVLVARLRQLVDRICRSLSRKDASGCLLGEFSSGCQVTIENLDAEYVQILMETCQCLLRSYGEVSVGNALALDYAWGAIQHEGDYSPLQCYTARKSPAGFVAIVDVELPEGLCAENHDRPPKGGYGFHDGLHNLIWKTDRTSDCSDFVHPGIVQMELTAGVVYIFPSHVRHICYPFSGPGVRKWIGAILGTA